jgi:MFS family permease
MRADNHGEGGILALLALISPRRAKQSRRRAILVVIGLLGATLLYGDGAITPAISVLSAIEGIKVHASQMDRAVVPLTVAILVLLFMVQRKGTSWLGGIFGPIMLVCGYLLAAIAKPLMGLSTVWQGVFGARLLDRLGAGSRAAPRDALIASSVDENDRGRAFGLEGFGDNLGAFLGPLLAVFFLYSLHVGIRAIFFLAIMPALLAFFMVLLVREHPAAVAAKSKIDFSLRQFPKGYWQYLLVIALFGLGNSSNSFLILQAQDIGASLETTILIYAAFNLVAALISYPAGSLSDRWGRKPILFASFIIFLAAYLGFALTQNIILIAALFVFYGAYEGIFRSVGKAFASDFVPEHLRASGIGWYSTTVGLLQLVASVVAGLLWDRVGHGAVFLYGAAFAVVGSVGLLVLSPAKHDNALRN